MENNKQKNKKHPGEKNQETSMKITKNQETSRENNKKSKKFQGNLTKNQQMSRENNKSKTAQEEICTNNYIWSPLHLDTHGMI